MGALTDPISDDSPFGEYLKSDRSAYRALRTAFNTGQSAYRALSQTPESLLDRALMQANSQAWSNVARVTDEVLKSKSKDIEVFTWHIASCVHTGEPLTGLLESLTALSDLVEQNWDDLQPIPPIEKLKATDVSDQKKEIDSLKLRLFLPLFGEVAGGGLLHLPLTNLPLASEITYGSFLLAEREDGIDLVSVEVTKGDPSALLRNIEVLQSILVIIENLDSNLRNVAISLGESPVPVSHFADLVKDILRMLKILTDGFVDWPGQEKPKDLNVEGNEIEPDSEVNSAELNSGVSLGVMVSTDSLRSRDTALANLSTIAAHFRTTEPHSPVHLLLDRALRWAQMPVTDLYSELLGEDSEGYAKLSLMAGLESYAYSGAGRTPKNNIAAKLPSLSDYKLETPKQGADIASGDEPNGALSYSDGSEEDTTINANDEPNIENDIEEDKPISSFEW